MAADMADPVALACAAPDVSRWILAAFGLATAVNVVLLYALRPRGSGRR